VEEVEMATAAMIASTGRDQFMFMGDSVRGIMAGAGWSLDDEPRDASQGDVDGRLSIVLPIKFAGKSLCQFTPDPGDVGRAPVGMAVTRAVFS
jgi:hypothetical protein